MNLDHIEKVLNRLPLLVVELDPNPVSRGPLYLQDLISKIRGMLNETGVYLQNVLRYKSTLESLLEAKEVSFQVSSDELLANDHRVTHLPAVQDRLAMINVLLRDQRKEVLELRKQVNDIGYVEKAVRHRHRELESTMSAVRLQRSLIQTELRTGSYFGDESETSRGGGTWGRTAPGKDGDIDEGELSRLLGDMKADEEAEEEVLEENDVASTAEEEVVEDSSGGRPPKAADSEDDGLGLDVEDFDSDAVPEGPSLYCSVCGEPQMNTPSGLVCENGHGGAPSDEDSDGVEIGEDDLPDAKVEAEDPAVSKFLGDDEDEDDFSDIFGGPGEDV
jgi:hypothetical protein